MAEGVVERRVLEISEVDGKATHMPSTCIKETNYFFSKLKGRTHGCNCHCLSLSSHSSFSIRSNELTANIFFFMKVVNRQRIYR